MMHTNAYKLTGFIALYSATLIVRTEENAKPPFSAQLAGLSHADEQILSSPGAPGKKNAPLQGPVDTTIRLKNNTTSSVRILFTRAIPSQKNPITESEILAPGEESTLGNARDLFSIFGISIQLPGGGHEPYKAYDVANAFKGTLQQSGDRKVAFERQPESTEPSSNFRLRVE